MDHYAGCNRLTLHPESDPLGLRSMTIGPDVSTLAPLAEWYEGVGFTLIMDSLPVKDMRAFEALERLDGNLILDAHATVVMGRAFLNIVEWNFVPWQAQPAGLVSLDGRGNTVVCRSVALAIDKHARRRGYTGIVHVLDFNLSC